ncbi:MAG TPA: IgGFc-binding protein, partial [Candidatus Kapabacteria bacterium]|nr:IgGFc-binding protein [Candidatus Kapabacteria bacterium]
MIFRFTRYFVFFFTAALAGIPALIAQKPSNLSSMGRDFYLGYLPPSIKCAAIKPFQGVFVLISSPYDCNVMVSYFNAFGKEITGATNHIVAKHSWQAPLDLSFMNSIDNYGNPINANSEVAEYTVCHIHADHPITVHYYSTGPNSGGETLILPTQVLGKNYVIASLAANPATGAANSTHFPCTVDSGSSEFMVIAVADSTKITITPNGRTMAGNIGVSLGYGATGEKHPFTATLERGQVYFVKSTLDNSSNDLSGTTVTSSKPVAVIAGHGDAINGETQTTLQQGGDQRNMLVQQMVPVQYWQSSGYVSMPFMDSPGVTSDDPSAGDLFKIFTDTEATSVSFDIYQGGSDSRTVAPYAGSPSVIDNVEAGMSASSTDGTPIMVEQYDYRAQGTSVPFTAPTMMNVVPLANYATTFEFFVADDRFQVQKHRYINVIARSDQFSKIKLWVNGAGPKPIASLSSAGSSFGIPGHSELIGRRYEIFSGNYFITGDSAFMVYNYGMIGLDPDNDLGDNDDDDYYFEYAAPCGETFSIPGASTPKATLDTLCGGWHCIATDTNALDMGLAMVEILNDPIGVLLRRPNSDSGFVSSNVDFDPSGFIIIPGETTASFDIKVLNPLQDAWAYVWVVNAAGKDTLMYLNYKAPHLSAPDSESFYFAPFATDTCTTVVFKNTANSTGNSYTITGYHFTVNRGFHVTNITPPLPFTLRPGDSITFSICFGADSAAKAYLD